MSQGRLVLKTRQVRVWVGGRQEGVPALRPWRLQSLRGHTIHRGLRHRHTIHSALRHAVPSCPLLLLHLPSVHLPSVLKQQIRHRSMPILCRKCQCRAPLRKRKKILISFFFLQGGGIIRMVCSFCFYKRNKKDS